MSHDEDIFDRLSKEYGLTKRDNEICIRLLFTEKSGREIADELSISRRVLQKHIASIYAKAGVKTRVGLFRKYHEFAMNYLNFKST